MSGYIFVGVVFFASWLFILSPVLILAYGVYTLVMEAKAAKAKKATRAISYIREARQCIKLARLYRAEGCPLAAKEAIRTANSCRKAAHAFWHYGE